MVRNIKNFEYIPVEYVVKKFEHLYTQKEIIARLKKLAQLKIIAKHPSMEAYRITFLGLDCLALKILVTQNIIKAIGDIIGIGKESEVYQGLSENNDVVAIKFYKIGKRSFKNVAKYRGYYSDNLAESSWLRRSILAGRREKEVLTLLNNHNISGVPKIYGGALHCVVMEFIEGIRLNEVSELQDPSNIFNQIIEIVKCAYKDVGIIHGDLSEYNIMITRRDDEELAYIIDWPQYVSSASPLAQQLLKRDILNIVKFFRKRFRLNIDAEEVYKHIIGA